MSKRGRPRVFSIAPGLPFLTTLADAVYSGGMQLVGFDPLNPLALADITIYLPTRRAARALRGVLAAKSKTGSALLPSIRALGEFDEDAVSFTSGNAESLLIHPPINGDDRILELARLTQAWSANLSQHDAPDRLTGGVNAPHAPADAIWMARSLVSVIDDFEREDIPFEKLREIDPESLSGWWQFTRDFLEIVTTHYPKHLLEQNLTDPVIHRSQLIRAEAGRLGAFPPKGPVIAAGSTGSIPATAELLKVIANLENGAVILPGLDFNLDEAAWESIGDAAIAPSSFGHPQYGMRKLMQRLGIQRSDVQELVDVPPARRARAALVSEALRPAETTDVWNSGREAAGKTALVDPLSGCALIEAPSERAEALAIAIALRESLDTKRTKTAALVTNDRGLAKRVSSELLRFGIVADDSAGTPLSNTPQANMFQLVLLVAFEPDSVMNILALLKHPLAQFGENKQRMARAAEALELIVFRGTTDRIRAEEIGIYFDKALQRAAAATRTPFWKSRLGPEEIEDAGLLATIVADLFGPLCAMRGAGRKLGVSECAAAGLAVFEAIGTDENQSLAELYGGAAGEEFANHLRGLLTAQGGLSFAAVDWPSVHAALLAGKAVKPKAGGDPNIFIWGALEARLQEADTMILGGLNENTWPAQPDNDPFLSRGMKLKLKLEPPERRVGQAAHDFMMGLGADRVILSRATRKDGAPTIASRWLQRILAYASKNETMALRGRGTHYLGLAELIDKLPDVALAERPQPSPPVALRPKHYSVTEIKTLRFDPYAIHAKRILGLRPLDPLIRDPDDRERGSLYHDIMAAFMRTRPDFTDPLIAAETLRRCARDAFSVWKLPLDIEALWRPRFEALVDKVVEQETGRCAEITGSLVEVESRRLTVGETGVTLSGRADRIDVRRDGNIDVLDYKTGENPSAALAGRLEDPQLALEAALAARGGFEELGRVRTNDILYYRLLNKGEAEVNSVKKSAKVSADALAEDAWARLTKLLEQFADPKAQYVSHRVASGGREGDYDHLSRLQEWSDGADEEAGPET